jgi:hypothetical protein
MCRQLDALRQSIVLFASSFDAALLTPAQATEVTRACAQIEASVASVKALAAARSAEGNSWQNDGYRSPAHQLADLSGMSPSSAKRALETGRRMASQPDVARAALAGELSPEQAAAVADGVAANPAVARDLIDKAKQISVPELNEEVARAKALAMDQEARHRAVHSKRSLRRWTDRDGAMQAHLHGHPEDGVDLWRMLDPVRRRLTVLRRDGSAPYESLDALDYDALMTLSRIASGQDGEVTFEDLLDLGLFPQFESKGPLDRPSAAGSSVGGSSVVGPSVPEFDSHGRSDSRESVPDCFDLFSSATPDGSVSERLNREGAVSRPSTPDAASSGNPDPPDTSQPPRLDSSLEPTMKRGRRKKMAGSPIRIMVRVDFDALLRGFPIEGELCEIVGYGPVPVSVVEGFMANDNAFLVGLMTKSHQLVGVHHYGRRPNAHQQSALDFLYPCCAVAGCPARAALQYDHREDWSTTKITSFDLLDRLCVHHHGLKTRRGWALVEGTGKRAFVPPDDPRHPRFMRRRNTLEAGALGRPPSVAEERPRPQLQCLGPEPVSQPSELRLEVVEPPP